MRFSFEFTRPQLKVFSSVCSNLFAAWFVASFVTQNPAVLTYNIIAGIVSLLLAIKAEKLLEEL